MSPLLIRCAHGVAHVFKAGANFSPLLCCYSTQAAIRLHPHKLWLAPCYVIEIKNQATEPSRPTNNNRVYR